MSEKSLYCGPDELYIERDGELITRITKAGVVIWPLDSPTQLSMDNPQYAEYLAQLRKEPYTAGMGANSTMIGGTHYKHPDTQGQCPNCKGPIEHWDWALNLRGLEYAITKHIGRWRVHPKPLDCLEKAMHYAQKLIEANFPGVVVTLSFAHNFEQASPAPTQSTEAEYRVGTPGSLRNQAGCSPKVDGQQPANSEVRRYTDQEIRYFLGYLCASLPELRNTEVPFVDSIWKRFTHVEASRG